VKARSHVRYAEFAYRFGRSSLRPGSWKGVTFRSVALEFAKPDQLVSGEGSRIYGGRWNAPGSFPAVYSSTKPGIAADEAFHLAANFELSPDDIKPRVTCGIEWRLSSVIDLTATDLPSWIELGAWLQEDFGKINDGGAETLCQAFGRAVRSLAIVAMLCPSARVANGVNLVVFPDRLARSDRIRVLGKGELTKHLA
jgi:RES domain-containing protein